MPLSPFTAALNQLADERGLPHDVVIEAIESAVAAAYRKDYGQPNQDIVAKYDDDKQQFVMRQRFTVVEEPENPQSELTLEEARKIKKTAALGEVIEIKLETKEEFGRIAAQTAKQVISQKLREAEKELLYDEYKEKQGQLINGYVQQVEGLNVIMNIGKLNGLMIASDQIPNQHYFPGQRLKILVYNVEETPRGPRVLVTRSSADFIRKLFELEVPEIASGGVEIKAISREAGTRTKMAVAATVSNLDPVGSCVGQRGTRVQAVLSEIGEEKIDIVPFRDDAQIFIAEALKPAKIDKIILKESAKQADVVVSDDQLSLAIGKNGQNVRLASKLTGWEINILKTDGLVAESQSKVEALEPKNEVEEATPKPKRSSAKKKLSEDDKGAND